MSATGACAWGSAIGQACRQGDIPTRYGGEEFGLVLPNTGAVPGRQIAARSCVKVASEVARPDGWPQTVSIGAATILRSLATGAGADELPSRVDLCAQVLTHADRALCAARDRGRNCVQVVATTWSPQGLVAPGAASGI